MASLIKFFIYATVFSVIIEVISARNDPHSIIESMRNPSDRIIYVKKLCRKFSFLRTIKIDVPFSTTYKITEVMVNDEWTDGTGGYPRITSGGIGKNFVNIRLESQFNRGLCFTIRIYGRQ